MAKPFERSIKTVKPMMAPLIVVDSTVSDGLHPEFGERYPPMFTKPDQKTVEYYTQEHDGKIQVFSKAYPLREDGTGVAHNFVAEKDDMKSAEELIKKLKNMG